jgi:hypothetical protein
LPVPTALTTWPQLLVGGARQACLDTRKFTQLAQAGSQHLAVPDNAAASLIEVTNAVPQASHDQA